MLWVDVCCFLLLLNNAESITGLPYLINPDTLLHHKIPRFDKSSMAKYVKRPLLTFLPFHFLVCHKIGYLHRICSSLTDARFFVGLTCPAAPV